MRARLEQGLQRHLERLGYAPGTIRSVIQSLHDFIDWMEGRSMKSLRALDADAVEAYHTYVSGRPNKRRAGGLSESTITHHIYTLKLLLNWAEETGQIGTHPMSGLRFRSPESMPYEVLSEDEIKRLYGVCENYKERVLLSLYYGCGLRRSEGEQVDLSDVDLRSKLLYVRKGKGGRRRVVPMSAGVVADIKSYVHGERPSSRREKALVLNHSETRMRGNTSNELLKRLLCRSGISKKISLHSLRHSIATHLLLRGMSFEEVRDFLGHKHLESTEIYTRINQEQLWKI